MLFKATASRLRYQCSDTSSRRRRRQTSDEEEEELLQYLNQDLMTRAVNDATDDIAQVVTFFSVFKRKIFIMLCRILSALQYLLLSSLYFCQIITLQCQEDLLV